jgi:ABC-type polar amino acid transport system ATPase subunit
MLAVNPGVLLLDEPLSNLDATLRLEMRAELRRMKPLAPRLFRQPRSVGSHDLSHHHCRDERRTYAAGGHAG